MAVVCTAALLLSLLAGGLRVWHVHDETWQWRLNPSATPPKVTYRDRDYSRGADAAQISQGFVRSGETMGGATIYAPAKPRTTTAIDVVEGDRVVVYGLMGGP
jgi:hypothetical protein